MEHIRQKISLTAKGEQAYTVVITKGWTLPLIEHPSIVENPDVFELVDDVIPEDAQYLDYTG
jgi:hypothetical protein